MPNTIDNLTAIAAHAHRYGLHTGNQFAAPGPCAPLDICAIAYIVAERCAPPAEFFTDEVASLEIIAASAGAMQAIRAISSALETKPSITEVAPGEEVPDYIEHVSSWVATNPIGEQQPPSVSEVIGRIHRAIRNLDALPTAA
ncbi:hypothetical protein [Streptomyces sp. ME19-01-6]|uniref:hypothetical protein n=1 Tax=Streptomyces sp. ME19-01-6 TaxID=3028686 RepID=UPI0029B93EBD|nr:hypothetical protein [Streptomyces sp. ME19-01-6]MDX3232937.1 hypothetical protein [Streptomyces sp. ME19-01-6]